MEDLISIIVPVYKIDEILLRNCMESILMQTYVSLEIIIIDDGSPDNCGIICDEYALKDKRIKVIHTENGGVSKARNIGLDNCAGDFIMFIDSDDYIASDFIETMHQAIISEAVECVISGCTKTSTTEKTGCSSFVNSTKILNRDEVLESLFYMEHLFLSIEITAVWGTLYKRDILQNKRFNEKMKIGEDFSFKLEVFKCIKKVLFLDSRGYYYFLRQDSAIRGSFNPSKMTTLYELEKIIDENKLSNKKAGVISRSINIATVLLLTIPIEKKYKKYRSVIIDFIKKYRFEVIQNPRTRFKVKMSLILSYFGFAFMQRIFIVLRKAIH
jgi:glycosyltransferase involved in cell wall biosynthesis